MKTELEELIRLSENIKYASGAIGHCQLGIATEQFLDAHAATFMIEKGSPQ